MEETKEQSIENIKLQLSNALGDLQVHPHFSRCKLLVVGCSTSEVSGQHIGTAGTMAVAEAIFQAIISFANQNGINVAFQCCEHLNRALVVNKATKDRERYEEVSVVPVREAGGALATYAFQHLPEAVMVERIQADAGIDIGDTFIGMHLKHVAVPVRSREKQVGEAHLTMAVTRPKLIGGIRSVYE